MAQWRVIPAISVPTYRKTMEFMNAVTMEAAPEVFRWVTWAAAVGVLEVVRLKIGSPLLGFLDWILYFVIVARIVAKVVPWRRKETVLPDGSIRIEAWPVAMIVLQVVAVIGCWCAAWLVAFEIPSQITEAELLNLL